MLVEMHLLQNHAPANLNRDDAGSPKDGMFGGVRRSRISSQALKRAIRRSAVFREALQEAGLGMRTRRLPQEVERILRERGLSEEMARLGGVKASGFGTRDGKEQRPDGTRGEVETAQMMFLTEHDVRAVADVVHAAALEAKTPAAMQKVTARSLQQRAKDDGWRPMTPDVALFGRMITSDAFRDVRASVQVAHALSTHRMEHEFDYFTAVDDLLDSSYGADEQGAGMIGDVEFTSACYYKYASIDVDGFIDNLVGRRRGGKDDDGGDGKGDGTREEAVGWATVAVCSFLEAAVFASPTGKQNSFAAHQLPDAILVEVRPRKIPVSYANAFVRPVQPRGGEDLVTLSIEALKDHVELLTRKYGLESVERLWFTTRDTEPAGTRPCATLEELLHRLGSAIEGWFEGRRGP